MAKVYKAVKKIENEFEKDKEEFLEKLEDAEEKVFKEYEKLKGILDRLNEKFSNLSDIENKLNMKIMLFEKEKKELENEKADKGRRVKALEELRKNIPRDINTLKGELKKIKPRTKKIETERRKIFLKLKGVFKLKNKLGNIIMRNKEKFDKTRVELEGIKHKERILKKGRIIWKEPENKFLKLVKKSIRLFGGKEKREKPKAKKKIKGKGLKKKKIKKTIIKKKGKGNKKLMHEIESAIKRY